MRAWGKAFRVVIVALAFAATYQYGYAKGYGDGLFDGNWEGFERAKKVCIRELKKMEAECKQRKLPI